MGGTSRGAPVEKFRCLELVEVNIDLTDVYLSQLGAWGTFYGTSDNVSGWTAGRDEQISLPTVGRR